MSLINILNEMGNPFLDDSNELLTLDARNVLDKSVINNTVQTIYKLGKEQYAKYYKDVIIDRTCSIHNPIKKNLLPLFSCLQPKTKGKQTGKISSLKSDVSLFSCLYIAMQHRESDMSKFFSHENHPFPPSLSDQGKLHFGKKSDLLEVLVCDIHSELPDTIHARILDGAAVVHLLPTVICDILMNTLIKSFFHTYQNNWIVVHELI